MTSIRPLLLFAAVAALAGCDASAPDAPVAESVPATPTPTDAPPALPAHRLDALLADADVPIDVAAGGHARLVDGTYTETGPGASGGTVVRLDPTPAFGDLDGDGVEDAAVVLHASPGGSGQFTYVAAVLDRGGRADALPAVAVGDRIEVDTLRIADGRIVLDWRDRAPGEPMASPATVPTQGVFEVRGGVLLPVVAAEGETLRGRYTWGAEVETLQPCGSPQSFWLAGDPALLQPLRDRALALSQASGKPYQPIYVEVQAISEGKASDGFAADHDAVYRLQRVQTVEDVVPADCAAPM